MPRRLLRLVSKCTPEPRQPGYAFSPEEVVWAVGSFCALNRKPLAADFNTPQTLSQAQFSDDYAAAAFPLALVTLWLTKVGNVIGLAVARALPKQRKILNCDEATSMLDSSTAEHFAAPNQSVAGQRKPGQNLRLTRTNKFDPQWSCHAQLPTQYGMRRSQEIEERMSNVRPDPLP